MRIAFNPQSGVRIRMTIKPFPIYHTYPEYLRTSLVLKPMGSDLLHKYVVIPFSTDDLDIKKPLFLTDGFSLLLCLPCRDCIFKRNLRTYQQRCYYCIACYYPSIENQIDQIHRVESDRNISLRRKIPPYQNNSHHRIYKRNASEHARIKATESHEGLKEYKVS